ncbi:MAG: AsmA family protein [Acetobacter sp.]|uniref:AsmA family protein n=1 Tax=Acetobacter sp. TaxID=440 RepID=UPI003F92E4FE
MRLKWKIGLLAGAAVVLLGGGSVVSALQDANWLRVRLASAVEERTGHHLTIDRLHVWILPFPWVEARGVRLSGVEDGGPDLLTADSVRARLALLPLFHHRIVLNDVSLTQPHILLRRLADGRADWQVAPNEASSDAGASGTGPAGGQLHWNLGISALQITKGEVRWQDDMRRWSGWLPLTALHLKDLEGDHPALNATIVRDKSVVTVTGGTGRLMPATAETLPVELKVAFKQDGHPAGLAHIDGTITDPAGKRSYTVNFGGSLAQLQSLQAFFPHAGLPQGQNISVDGIVGGEGAEPVLQGLYARSGAVDLSQFLPGASLGRLMLDATQPTDKMALVVDGKLGAQDLGVRGTLGTLAQLTALTLDPAHAETPAELMVLDGASNLRIAGTLGGGHSALDIHGVLGRLALGDGRPTIEDLKADGHVEAADTLGLIRKHAAPDVVRGLSGVVDVQTPHITWQGQTWTDFTTHVVVHDARLTADPMTAQGSGVQQSGRFTYSAAQPVPEIEVSARPVLLPVGIMQQWLGAPDLVQGIVTLVGTVSAHGTDAATIRQTITGHIGASIVDGTLGGAALRTLLGPQVPVKGKMPVRCFGTHMQVSGGVATLDLLGLESDFLSLHGHGTVGLEDHALNLHLSPHVQLGGTSAGSDVQVTGTFAAPVPKMEPAYSGRYGITIGGDDGGEDSCPALLSAAREGAAGPAASAPRKGKEGKVMNMLRGLGLFQ